MTHTAISVVAMMSRRLLREIYVKGPRAISSSRGSLACALLVLCVSAINHGVAMKHNRSHRDELDWTTRTYFYRLAFLERDLTHRLWADYDGIDQPHMTDFLIGCAFQLAGQDIPPVPERPSPWIGQPRPRNARLQVGRAPGAILGALVAVLVYAIGVLITGKRVVGMVAGLVYACHPLALDCQPMAMSDAPLMFFGTLAVLTTVWAIRPPPNPENVSLSLRQLVLLAVAPPCIGLAVGTKLTGAYFGVTVGLLVTLFMQFGDYGRKAAYLLLFVLLAEFCVIAVNPTLYPDPLGQFRSMVDHRLSVARSQCAYRPNAALVGIQARLGTVCVNLAKGRSNRPTEWPLVILGCIGTLSLLASATTWLVGRPVDPRAASLLIWSGVLMFGLAPALPLNWERYYLPFLPCWSLLVGVGTAAVIEAMRSAWRRSPGLTPRVVSS